MDYLKYAKQVQQQPQEFGQQQVEPEGFVDIKQKTNGFEIISNLVRYCNIYMSRCTDLPKTTHFIPLIEDFVEKIEKKYPLGTPGRVKLISQLVFATYYLLDPEIHKVTEAGCKLEKEK